MPKCRSLRRLLLSFNFFVLWCGVLGPQDHLRSAIPLCCLGRDEHRFKACLKNSCCCLWWPYWWPSLFLATADATGMVSTTQPKCNVHVVALVALLVMGQVSNLTRLRAERFHAAAHCVQEEPNQSRWTSAEVRSSDWSHHRGITLAPCRPVHFISQSANLF